MRTGWLLPVIPCGGLPFIVVEFLIVASCAVYFRPAKALYSGGVNWLAEVGKPCVLRKGEECRNTRQFPTAV
jgi:hypothetical protein